MLADEVLAALKGAGRAELPAILSALSERFTPAALALELARMNDGDAAPAANPFMAGLISAADMPPAQPPRPLFFGVYPGHVTLLNGVTGGGKSSALYNIALACATSTKLWEQEPALPPDAAVLYVDPENAGDYRNGQKQAGLCGKRLERIGGERPPNLLFHDGRGVDLCQQQQRDCLAGVIQAHSIALVIIDPIVKLMATKDENDNAEGNRQMAFLCDLARVTGAAILATHHLGKDESGDYGRGASARLAAADVGMAWRIRGRREDDGSDAYGGQTVARSEVCRLQITKDRPGWFGATSLYLRMAGNDRFELAEPAEWRALAPYGQRQPRRAADDAAEGVMALMQDGKQRGRQEIIDALAQDTVRRDAADTALRDLVTKGELARTTGARNASLYSIPVSVSEPLYREPETETDAAARNGREQAPTEEVL